MKKYIIAALLLIISLSIISCEENFSPKADFKDEYVLNSIISGDANAGNYIEFISLSKVYNVEGLNPYLNKTDPTVLGAEVTLRQNDITFKCVQDTITRFDTSRYNSPYIYYASPSLQINANDQFWISVKLPNGKTLSGYTRMPRPFVPTFSYPFNSGVTTQINRFLWGNSWQIIWENYTNDIFFPKLTLIYQKKINDSTTSTYAKEVPYKYIDRNGTIEPVYPTYVNNYNISYDFDAIDSTMKQISAGDPNKQNYKVISFMFQMLEFDPNLSNYYSSTHGYLDNFSIRLDESIFSNINGGIGIVGSKMITKMSFPVNHNYASTFGYSAQ